MKKVLLTSTALVAFSGAAFAEIAITGSAEMGIAGGDISLTNAEGESFDETVPAQFFQDVDVNFAMSGETDGGLAFGVAVNLDEAAGIAGTPFDDHGVAVFISGDFGTLTMGDTDGALDFVITDMGNAGNPGSINDAETGHLGYLGAWLDGSGDGQIVRYDYSFDAFTFAVSVEQGGQDSNGPIIVEGDNDLTWAVGAGYDFEFGGGDFGVAIGYQYSDNGAISVGGDADGQPINVQLGAGEVAATAIGLSLGLDNGLEAALTYTMFDFDEGDDATHIGVGAGYAFDAFSIHANYGQWDGGDATITGYGLAAGYDLGGGASLLAGWGASTVDVDDSEIELDENTYSLGLSFAF